MCPFPLDAYKVKLAAGLLIRGGYRSGPLYLAACKRVHIEEGYQWTDALALVYRDANRAVGRGLGPAQQADPFDLDKVMGIKEPDLAAIAAGGGPGLPRQTVLVASWWLMREIEVGTAACTQFTFMEGAGCGSATLDLPASKTDQQALGKKRTHTCVCPSAMCPVRAARELVAFSQSQGSYWAA